VQPRLIIFVLKTSSKNPRFTNLMAFLHQFYEDHHSAVRLTTERGHAAVSIMTSECSQPALPSRTASKWKGYTPGPGLNSVPWQGTHPIGTDKALEDYDAEHQNSKGKVT
jgi:hypothetical protein